jgi:CheY-like chemotaxis protein
MILFVLTSKGIKMTHDVLGHRILLIEDEGMIAMLVEDMLEDLGHKLVRVANRLEEAIAAARSEAIDLAILDLNLGGVLTYPAADALAERGIPFIFATGYGSSGLKEAYSSRPTLQKPFDTEALGHAIQQAFGHGS